MPFTNTQAESLIAQINAISLQNEEEAVKILSTIIAKLKATDTLSEKKEASKKEPNIASQLAVECVQEHFNARLQQISSTPKTQPLLELIELLFNIHTAEDINAVNAEGRTLLELALATSDLDMLRMLVERYHANVNAVQDDDGNTLLHIKLKQGDYLAARALIEVGKAAVNARNHSGKTPLHIVAEQGNLQMAQLLVEWGADVNPTEDREGDPISDLFATMFPGLNLKKDAEGPTPLSLAVAGRHMDIAKLLVARKANVNGGGSVNFPLHYAVRNGDLDGFKFLAAQQGADVYGNAKCLVAEAAENGHLELLKYLKQEYGIDITTALDRAAKAGHLKIVEFLEECGAKFDIHLVERILVKASRRGDLPAIKFWLRRLQPRPPEWAPALYEEFDVTALHAAAAGGHIATIEFWLKRGFAINRENLINRKNHSGNTLLYAAVEGGHLEAVKWLVTRKADVNARGWWGGSILGATQNRQIIDYLVAHGAKIGPRDGYTLGGASARLLWPDWGLNPHVAAQGFSGDYPWHAAAAAGDLKRLQFGLNRKVDINAQDNWGHSLLHAAADNNHVELVRFLLKQGATADIKNWQEGSNSRAKREIANLLEDFSVNHEAAEQIHNTVNSLFPGWLSLRNHLPTVLEKIVWGYVGTPQLPVKIVLVEQALRKLAKGMHNRSLVETREVWIQRLEEAKRKIVATIKDPKLKAECNDYWKQLKRKKSLYLNSSSAEYDSVLDAKLDKAFEEIPVPSKTYTPPLASLSTQPKTEVNKAKAEEKEKEMKHTVAADDMMDDEASDTVRAKEPQLSSRSNFSFSSSSSSSCAPQQPAIEYSFPIESKQGLIPFSFAQIIAAEAESRKKVQRVQKGKGASRSINRGTKRERESEKEVEREKDSCETTVALSQNMMGSAVNFFLQAGKKENEGIKQEQSTAQATEGLKEKEGGSNKKPKKASGSKNSSINSFKS